MTEDIQNDDVREEEGADDELGEEGAEDEGDDAVEEVEVAKYKITGLVHTYDLEGKVTGQLPIGSVQELPVVVGNKAVEEKRAELVE